jgi:hypothetical protein
VGAAGRNSQFGDREVNQMKVRPKLSFRYDFTEGAAFQVEQRGWTDAVVKLSTGRRVAVVFYDAVRLSHDLKSVQESGEVCIGEPGMIIIPTVTLNYMERAYRNSMARATLTA